MQSNYRGIYLYLYLLQSTY